MARKQKKKTSYKRTKKRKTASKKKVVKKKFFDKPIHIVMALAALVVIAVLISEMPEKVSAEVVLDMYVMSQCPYGAQAENEAIKAVKRFGDDVEYNIHFIVNSQGEGFRSLHGQAEVDENMRQVCIQELNPDIYYDYLLCFNENYKDAESQHSKCADQVGIDKEAIFTCVSDRGVELLKASEAETAKVGAGASPTIYLNGESYSGGRSEMEFARAICEIFDYEHEGCANIPKPVPMKVIVLTDDECPNCDTSRIVSVSKQLFPGASFEYVDVDSKDGKKLVEEHSLVYLPAYIFESKIEETNTWKTNTQVIGAFVISADGYRLRDSVTGASWFIDEEKQAEFFASIGVVKGDNRPQIDFFVMSYCPYGNMAEEAIAPVYEKLKDKAEFKPHYVIYSDYATGYPDFCLAEDNVICSMHGIVELNQDIREACVAKNYDMQEWFEFALAMNRQCNSQNADACWVEVAESLGLDTELISVCEADEGIVLMNTDKALGDKLGVRGSPAVFIDGAQYNGQRTANGYLAALCAAFEDAPEECSGAVQEPMQQQAPPAGGACG